MVRFRFGESIKILDGLSIVDLLDGAQQFVGLSRKKCGATSENNSNLLHSFYDTSGLTKCTSLSIRSRWIILDRFVGKAKVAAGSLALLRSSCGVRKEGRRVEGRGG